MNALLTLDAVPQVREVRHTVVHVFHVVVDGRPGVPASFEPAESSVWARGLIRTEIAVAGASWHAACCRGGYVRRGAFGRNVLRRRVGDALEPQVVPCWREGFSEVGPNRGATGRSSAKLHNEGSLSYEADRQRWVPRGQPSPLPAAERTA